MLDPDSSIPSKYQRQESDPSESHHWMLYALELERVLKSILHNPNDAAAYWEHVQKAIHGTGSTYEGEYLVRQAERTLLKRPAFAKGGR